MPQSPDPADPGAWLDDYSRRFTQTVDDSVRAGMTSAQRWARRAREDQERTTASLTADAITEWEELTPLLGRWLDLWLEASQRPFAGQPSPPTPARAEATARATGDESDGLDDLLAQRAAEYRELFDAAAAKFRTATYRSEDLLDDWLAFSGKAARDVTAGAAAFWGRLAGGGMRTAGPGPSGPVSPRAADPARPG